MELKQRSQVPIEHQWDLTSMFESDTSWNEAFDKLSASYTAILGFEGRLNEGGETLLACYKLSEEIELALIKLYIYANLKHHEDMTNTEYKGLFDKVSSLYTKIMTATSFIEPELTIIGDRLLTEYLPQVEGLAIYRQHLQNILRKKEHVLTPDKESLMAQFSEIGEGISNIYDLLTDADMTFENAKDSKGEEHLVTMGRFGAIMENKDRELRKNAFKSVYKSFVGHKNSIAEAYSSSVKYDNFIARVRNHPSAMDMALFSGNIPTDIYHNLVSTVNKNLHLYHRYMRIRKKCLKLDDFRVYDKYVPIVENANTKISWDESKELVLKGLAPLGEEYVSILHKAFDERWIDIYENKGKYTGAYSHGGYGTKPYILMNFDDTVRDMFTLAHELGHSVHSYYSRKHQPPVYSNYTIFLAEIASTVNEALVHHYMLNNTKDKTEYNYLLNYLLSNFDSTFFRQCMFAEFEMTAHKMADEGQPLNSHSLNEVYHDLLSRYFGPDVILDDEVSFEWSRIPHFYSAYYVYQYSTGFAAAMAFSKDILDGKTDRYIDLLKSGSSDYSIELLKKAGLDMTSPKPIESALSVFESLLDKFEENNFNESR